MTLQIIKSIDGKAEYVLLPISVYKALHHEIESKLKKIDSGGDYVPFDPSDYVENPIALARIKAHLTQEQLSKLLKVSQPYLSKIEKQEKVTAKLLMRVNEVLKKLNG